MKHENFLELLLFSEFIIDSHYITMNQQKLYTKLLEVFSFTKLDSTVSKTPPDKLMPFGLKIKHVGFLFILLLTKKEKLSINAIIDQLQNMIHLTSLMETTETNCWNVKIT